MTFLLVMCIYCKSGSTGKGNIILWGKKDFLKKKKKKRNYAQNGNKNEIFGTKTFLFFYLFFFFVNNVSENAFIRSL